MSNTDPYAGGDLPISDLERGPSAKFEELGDKAAGVIVSVKRQQQTDLTTGELKFFPSGDKMMLTVITLERADGTTATLYAKGGAYEAAKGSGKALETAIVEAVKAAGGTSIRRGDMLAVEHTGLSKKKAGYSAAKLFTAEYRLAEPANASVAVDSLFTD
jgi:hypothetical protein